MRTEGGKGRRGGGGGGRRRGTGGDVRKKERKCKKEAKNEYVARELPPADELAGKWESVQMMRTTTTMSVAMF